MFLGIFPSEIIPNNGRKPLVKHEECRQEDCNRWSGVL